MLFYVFRRTRAHIIIILYYYLLHARKGVCVHVCITCVLYNVRIFNTVLHVSERPDRRTRVWGGGGETVRRKIVRAGLFLNISTAVHAAAAAVVRFPRRPYITREAGKRDLYRRGGASDPRLLFPDWIKTPLSLRIHTQVYNMHTRTYIYII